MQLFAAVSRGICVAKAQLELKVASTVGDSLTSLRKENNAPRSNSSHVHTLSQYKLRSQMQ